MLRPVQWQHLIARTCGWTPTRYAPLRVALNAQEQRRLGRKHPLLIGWVVSAYREEFTQRFPEFFCVDEDRCGLLMYPIFESVEARTAAFLAMTEVLRDEGAFPMWQREQYAAKRFFRDTPLFYFQRGVGARFGLSEFATHLNGFTRNPTTRAVDNVWIATRSAHKDNWPSKLDTIVGGGLPAHIAALDNMVKEAQEEAGLLPEWTRPRLQPTGSLSYLLDTTRGLDNNTMFVYDLELPLELIPHNQDGEVEKFELWRVQDVVEALHDEPERFKPDICLVLLDFCVRHGVLDADNCDDLERLVRTLHSAPAPYEE